jgi:uncharacterized protein YjbI with pentapeptide repeats
MFRLTALWVVLALFSAASAMARDINGCPIRPGTLCVGFDLRAAKLREADLARSDLSRSDLTGSDLRGARLLSADLHETRLNKADLSGADLSRADLTNAELQTANLRHAQLVDVNLRGADLTDARLDEANLRAANLSAAHFKNVSLHGAQLERADLSNAFLQDADLSGADLAGANLSHATLTNANLTGAFLVGAILDGANTEGCRGCPTAAAQVSASTAKLSTPSAPDGDTLVVSGPAHRTETEDGCWAKLFLNERFQGKALTLVGAVEVANLAKHWGFPWEPLYESVQVGPGATLIVFDEPQFQERTMVFASGQRVPDLDRVMGVFRTIRSVKLRCSAQ